jgi:hypothetical protein
MKADPSETQKSIVYRQYIDWMQNQRSQERREDLLQPDTDLEDE